MTGDSSDVVAHYLLVAEGDPTMLARAIAGEMSSGTFLPVPGETPALVANHQARVLELSKADDCDAWHVRIAVPTANIGASLPAVLTAVAGNIFELSGPLALLLRQLDLPESVTASYPGPRFGASGSRQVMQVEGRPMFGSIVKPSVGLSPLASSELAGELARAGLDFLKDDELQSNSPHSPFVERFRLTTEALDRAAEATGRRMSYAFNITGELDDMARRIELLNQAGADTAMIVVPSVGLPALTWLRRHSEVPIHAHRAGWAVGDRGARFGISFAVWQQLWRYCGADQIHIGGLHSKFYEDDATVVKAFRAVSTPLALRTSSGALPVLSSAQTPDHVALTMEATRSTDFLMLAGGGIMAHPGGPAAGVQAFHAAYSQTQEVGTV